MGSGRRRAAEALLVVVASAGCWAAWIASDRYVVPRGDHHPVPYENWQLFGCAACLAVVIVVGLRRLPAMATVLGVPATLVVSCSVSGLPGGNVAMDAWATGAFGVIVLGFAFAVIGLGAAQLVAGARRRAR